VSQEFALRMKAGVVQRRYAGGGTTEQPHRDRAVLGSTNPARTAGTSCHHTSRLVKIQLQKRFGSSDAMSWLGEPSRTFSAMSFPVTGPRVRPAHHSVASGYEETGIVANRAYGRQAVRQAWSKSTPFKTDDSAFHTVEVKAGRGG